jgi:hypothetical protein
VRVVTGLLECVPPEPELEPDEPCDALVRVVTGALAWELPPEPDEL